MVEGWKTVRIGNIADIKNGPFGSVLHAEDYEQVGVPIITVEHLVDGRIAHTQLPLVGEKNIDRLESYRLCEGDIVYSRVGSVDRCAYVSSNEDGWLFSGRTLRLRFRANEICARYLVQLFQSEPMKEHFRAVAVGQTMPSLNTKLMANTFFVAPPLEEQKAIAKSLGDVDELIASLEALVKKKRDIRQGVMCGLLTRKNVFEGQDEECTMTTLGDVAMMNTSTIYCDDINQSEYIGTDNMLSGCRGVVPNEIKLTYTTVKEYLPGDTLISNIRPYLKKSWFATRRGGCSNDVIVFRSRDSSRLTPRYLSLILSSDEFFAYVSEYTSGTKMPRGDKAAMLRYVIKLPNTVEEQDKVVETILDLDASIAALEQKLTKYRLIKQGMMEELFSGRIRLV